MQKPKEFQIPDGILEQMNEFSSGGYLLFTFDIEGNPRIICRFDSAVHSMGAQKYLAQWLDAVNETQTENIAQAIRGNSGDDDEDGLESA